MPHLVRHNECVSDWTQVAVNPEPLVRRDIYPVIIDSGVGIRSVHILVPHFDVNSVLQSNSGRKGDSAKPFVTLNHASDGLFYVEVLNLPVRIITPNTARHKAMILPDVEINRAE